MWGSTVKKLTKLKEMDKQCLSFGAELHHYQLLPCVSNGEIERVENQLEIVLPIELKLFYSNIGNGIAGPYYGLTPINEIKGYRQNELYPGVDALKENAKDLDIEYLNYCGEGYFEVYHQDLRGLIPVIHEGCGHEICLISNGNKIGKIVYVSANGHIEETDKSLIDIYQQWLDKEIILFETIKALMLSGATFSYIDEEIRVKLGCYDSSDIILSLADVPKQKYSRAAEVLWCESVLLEWQKCNL